MIRLIKILSFAVTGLAAFSCTAQKTTASAEVKAIAFPGAEGYGKYTTGGRGGKVFIVTTLEDSGPGSLREAVNAKGSRTIVFAVSGTIALKSRLGIRNGDLTIAGQTAPGDGICLKNYTTTVEADNVIIRFIRFRLGPDEKQEDDAINGRGHNNIIIDHCSATWSVDECLSFYRNKNFTVQWCLVAESLNHSVHVKGDHGYGGIWGGEGASYHHNILADHKSRNPRFSGSSTTVNPEDELVDYRNNVIFNWEINSAYGGEKGKYNMVNNYYKPGPATPKNRKNRIVNPSSPYGQFFVDGNVIEGDLAVSANNWNGGVQCDFPDSTKADKPFDVVAIPKQSAKDAYEEVLKYAGASLKRDAADARVITQIKTGKANTGKDGNGIIDSPADVGGWPELKSLPALIDSDKDGIPDDWEKTHGLNPNDTKDGALFTIDKQYTNLEVYMNGLVKW